jgi:hypothetical protein
MGSQSVLFKGSVEYDPLRALAVGFFIHKGVMVKPSLQQAETYLLLRNALPKQNNNV